MRPRKVLARHSYCRARYYDPNIGRFLSEDPAKEGPNQYSYVRNSPVLSIDPAGLLDIEYKVNRYRKNFWSSSWHAGAVQPHYLWKATCNEGCDLTTHKRKWRLNLKITMTFDFGYSSDSNREHEQHHLDIAIAFIERNRSHFEALEGMFDSKAECNTAAAMRVNGLRHSGRPPDIKGIAEALQVQLDKEQEAFDGFWGFVFNHLL